MMDPSVVQQQGPVDHVLQHAHNAPSHHQDLSVVDHLSVLPTIPTNVTGHLLGAPPGLGGPYQLGGHQVLPTVPTTPSAVHIVPNNINPPMAGTSPYVHPGLMQEQTEKYGPLLFHKDDQGLYTCFFTGCGKKLKANFSRHVAKHEMDGDKMDPNLANQIQSSSASKNLGTTKICSHPTHQEWWGTSPEQPVTEFYKRCSKCKKCYIRLQQESKRQRLSLESLNASPMGSQGIGMVGQYAGDMFQQGVNGMPIFDHQHLKRDSSEEGDDQGPNKRMRIEENPQILATLQALAEKHFKEMAELTARHSADSRKLISHNSTLRLTTDLRHAKEKEELEAHLRREWDQFRLNCLKEREELYQTQVLALHRELQGATVPSRPCRLCNKRMLSTFLYQCNLCNEEACIRCQAVMVCGVCGTKSCENCTIKHNWLIWCDRCHKTYCSNHRGLPDNLCPGCEQQQKNMELMMHDQSHQSQSLHSLHQDVLGHSDQLQMHHQEELMPQQLKFEDLGEVGHEHHHHHHHQHHSHHTHHHHHTDQHDGEHQLGGDLQGDLLQHHEQDPHLEHQHIEDPHGMHHLTGGVDEQLEHHPHHHHHHDGQHMGEEHHPHLGQHHHEQELAQHQASYESELQEHQHEHQPHHQQNGQEHGEPPNEQQYDGDENNHQNQEGELKYEDLDPHAQPPSMLQ